MWQTVEKVAQQADLEARKLRKVRKRGDGVVGDGEYFKVRARWHAAKRGQSVGIDIYGLKERRNISSERGENQRDLDKRQVHKEFQRRDPIEAKVNCPQVGQGDAWLKRHQTSIAAKEFL